ncbi:unnamed protein product, partial [Scytosiphon promiscuus]
PLGTLPSTQFSRPVCPVASLLWQNLLRRMLEKDPEQRIDLTAAINHPWVTVEGSIRP